MSGAFTKEEIGASENGDCNIANLKKYVKIKDELLEEDEDLDVKKKYDVEIKVETKIKKEPDKVEIKNEIAENNKGKVKKESIDINMDVGMNVEIKNKPLDEKVKDKGKNVEMQDEDLLESDDSENESEKDTDQSEYSIVSDSEEGEIEYPYVNAIKNGFDMVAKLGTFACGEILEGAKLKLNVKGVGEIKLPLSYRQGEILKTKACTVAPYGKGNETIVDKNVRDAWQVDAKDVTLDNKFNKLVKGNITNILKTLMGESSIENIQVVSELYKLVYYEKEGHFLPHRDTEKALGMFATLVIQLPAGHEGGELVVRHKGETKVFDFEVDSRDNYYYTAFFADCEHELKRIIGGHRLLLIYNLIRKSPPSILNPNCNDDTKPSNIQSFISIMKKTIQEWETDNKGPQYLTLNLDHLYSDTNISFQHLKGKDKKIADALCLCEYIKVYLATINKNESRWGYNEYGGSMSPDLAPIGAADVEPSTYSLDNWMGVDNNKPCFGHRRLHSNQMLVKEEEMFSEIEDKRCGSEYEYTGNEGCNINFYYKKRALIFLPKSFELSMSCDANLRSVLVKCKEILESKIDDALEMFKGILLYIEKRNTQAMSQLDNKDLVAFIFEIMILFEDTIKFQANTFLLSLVKPYGSRYSKYKVCNRPCRIN